MPSKEFCAGNAVIGIKDLLNSKCPFADSQIEEMDSQRESSPTASGLTSQSMNSDLNMQS